MSSSGMKAAMVGIGVAAIFTIAGAAGAAVISINVGGFDANHDVPAMEQAGAVPAIRWNNLTNDNNPAAAGTLVDDSGALVPNLKVNFSGWSKDTFNAWGDARANMYSNFLHHQGDTLTDATVVLENIPFAKYDVYIYYTEFVPNQVQTWIESENNTTLYGLRGPTSGGGLGGYVNYQNPSEAGALADAAAGATGGNYLWFADLTAANLTLTSGAAPDQPGFNQRGIAGIQIVAVPEPASLSLLGLGAFALLARRSRNNAR